MNTMLYVEINIFALAILFVIYINMKHQAGKYLFEQKLFLCILASDFMMLVFDSFMWVLDKKTGMYLRDANILFTELYYIFSPIPCMLWTIYADYQVYRDERRFKKLLIPMSIPVIINAILSVMSLFGNYLFYIDPDNVYHRGKLFYVMAAACYLYLVHTMFFILKKRDKVERGYFIPLLTYGFPPVIGGILQALYYGISLVWISTTVSVLIVFINIQNNQLYKDHLTGLFNRRQLDYYLQDAYSGYNSRKRLLAGIMIDLNYFKDINDIYGHAVGDQALELTGQILNKSFRKEDFIARYGGDEFVVILEIDGRDELRGAVERLMENTSEFNQKKLTPYEINLSMGYDILDKDSGMTIQQFLKKIDSQMYEDKKVKKELKRLQAARA